MQPYVRLPLDYEETTAYLGNKIDSRGFDGIFGRHR